MTRRSSIEIHHKDAGDTKTTASPASSHALPEPPAHCLARASEEASRPEGDGENRQRLCALKAVPDPANLLRATNTWTINVSANLLSLIDPMWLTNGRFRLTVTGTAPQGFVIQASTNLINWNSLSTNTLTASRFDYTNSGQTNTLKRFYRAYTPP